MLALVLSKRKYEEVHEGDEEAQQNSVNPFGKVEPLRENPSPDIDSYSASESVYLAQYKDWEIC